MSYSTRRSGGFANQPQQQQQQNVGSIGQRRPVVTNNFVPGGQLNAQSKPGVQQQATQPQQVRPAQPQQAQNTGIQFRNQQQATAVPQQAKPQPVVQQQLQQKQQQLKQQQLQQQQLQQQQLQQQQLQQQQLQQQQQQQLQQQQQQIKMEASQTLNKPEAIVDNSNGDVMDTSVEKKKPFWARGTAGKITKKEKNRRRNVRLSKILQPKNAVMILNELVKNTSYMVEDLPMRPDGNQFKATVVYEGTEYCGYGRSKIHAKNSAAEAALKNYVKTNRLTEMKKDEEGNENMDVSEDDTSQSPLPWQHVASFALFKLFCSWGEDPNLLKNQQAQFELSAGGPAAKQHENRPAKKMPANPESINPLMLINQMLPHAHFEEIGKTGNPPNVTFSFRCNCDGQTFLGTGPNKKAAKKLAAYGACNKILGVNYPTDVYVPLF
ncbi:unnamed protein product [Phaedon cochleariae]|uniref:DRBM domain-containing protein n=1 Tax=Phaedon cochleariae TaxID=80249 RepID=A0A9N9S7U4_PHACE|nr:unnamed protein product [Phaedon cochleariae]